MTRVRFLTLLAIVLLISVHAQGCSDPIRVETIRVSLQNGEIYQFPTVGGDEEGARISTAPKHYNISEIRRNAATKWVATFVYQPAAGFVGSDYAEIETLTGSDGASAPTNVRRVAFQFGIHN
jgi:hypothetical protein